MICLRRVSALLAELERRRRAASRPELPTMVWARLTARSWLVRPPLSTKPATRMIAKAPPAIRMMIRVWSKRPYSAASSAAASSRSRP